MVKEDNHFGFNATIKLIVICVIELFQTNIMGEGSLSYVWFKRP